MDEARLIEKLAAIEALFAGATTDGERVAADRAKQRIRQRLEQVAVEDPPIEYKFTLGDLWSRKVMVALLRRYEIQPYRYRRQRFTTVMARVSRRFVDETLWPEFEQFSKLLDSYLSDVTERVVSEVLHEDTSEASVVEEPKQLGPGLGSSGDAPTKVAGATQADAKRPQGPTSAATRLPTPATNSTPTGRPKKIGRNQPCWCGSGKKYKRCHEAAGRR